MSGLTPQDTSANLTSGGNGRFEQGTITIGGAGGAPTAGLDGNGDTYVQKAAGIDVPAAVEKVPLQSVLGKVVQWSGSVFTLMVSSGTLSSDYVGGTLNVAGTVMGVSGVTGKNVTVGATGPIPFVLHDDDDDNVLPSSPSLSDLQEADDPSKNRFAGLYIRPV